MTADTRIAIVFDNFGPYHVARLAAAAERFRILAIEVSPNNNEYAWDKQKLPECVDYLALTSEGGLARNRTALRQAYDDKLSAWAPDCVAIPGWSSIAALELVSWCADRRIPMICMSDSNEWDAPRSIPVEFVKRGIVKHFSSGLVAGASHANYLNRLGLRTSSIFLGYDVVDNEYFAKQADLVRASGVMPSVDGIRLPEALRFRYFLASSRFVEKKNLPMLLDSYAAFRQGRPHDDLDWPLIILGDGEMRSMLEARIEALGLSQNVKMPGFRQYDELPSFFGTAGAFVHVSTVEQWGLVINEALASGLPVILSKQCGCAETLITEGENGLIIDPMDKGDIANALSRMTQDEFRKLLAQQASTRIAEWGPARFADGLADAACFATQTFVPRPRWIDRQCLKAAISRLA